EECRALLAAAPERGRFGRWGRGKRATAPAADAAAAPGGDGAQQAAAAPARRKGARKKAAPARISPKPVAANQRPVTGGGARARGPMLPRTRAERRTAVPRRWHARARPERHARKQPAGRRAGHVG